jgi:hypothetical protein
MLTFTYDELRSLSVVRSPPQRAVRKKLFTFQLWRPACRGQLAWERLRRAIPTPVPPTHIRTPDQSSSITSSITIGWLNAQSLRNKTDCINAAITDRSLDAAALTLPATTTVFDWQHRLDTPSSMLLDHLTAAEGLLSSSSTTGNQR